MRLRNPIEDMSRVIIEPSNEYGRFLATSSRYGEHVLTHLGLTGIMPVDVEAINSGDEDVLKAYVQKDITIWQGGGFMLKKGCRGEFTLELPSPIPETRLTAQIVIAGFVELHPAKNI